jgi:NADPH:quinone reductase-like Zn-dependent oxidoreductase
MKNRTMNAWRLHGFGMEQLTFDKVDIPIPGENEVLIKVGAVSLNFRDKAIIDGYYDPELLKKGALIMVGDAAGTIIEVGSGVSRLSVGDRVTSHLYSQWLEGTPRPNESEFIFGGPLPGGLAEYMILPDYAAVEVPAHLSLEEASTLPIAGLTAWFALTNFRTVKKGDTILIQGTGGVSIFAIQLASALGATVIVTTSSVEKGERAKILGATHIVNYNERPDWEQAVLELTGKKGVDQVLEVVGGEKSINKSIQAAKVEGLITIIGFLEGEQAKISLLPLIFKQTKIQGMAVGHRKAFETMNGFLEQHQIRPVIDSTYNFQNAPDAFRHLSKGAFGKVVIKID